MTTVNEATEKGEDWRDDALPRIADTLAFGIEWVSEGPDGSMKPKTYVHGPALVEKEADGCPMSPERRIENAVQFISRKVISHGVMIEEVKPSEWPTGEISHAGMALLHVELALLSLRKGDLERAENRIEMAEGHLAFLPTADDVLEAISASPCCG